MGQRTETDASVSSAGRGPHSSATTSASSVSHLIKIFKLDFLKRIVLSLVGFLGEKKEHTFSQ